MTDWFTWLTGNNRIQAFSPSGEFLSQLTDVARPTEVFVDPQDNVYVAEMGWKAGLFPWHVLPPGAPSGRLSIFEKKGLLSPAGAAVMIRPPRAIFFAPHDVWVDRAGDVYVTEVLSSGGFNRALFARDGHFLQKFARIRP